MSSSVEQNPCRGRGWTLGSPRAHRDKKSSAACRGRTADPTHSGLPGRPWRTCLKRTASRFSEAEIGSTIIPIPPRGTRLLKKIACSPELVGGFLRKSLHLSVFLRLGPSYDPRFSDGQNTDRHHWRVPGLSGRAGPWRP